MNLFRERSAWNLTHSLPSIPEVFLAMWQGVGRRRRTHRSAFNFSIHWLHWCHLSKQSGMPGFAAEPPRFCQLLGRWLQARSRYEPLCMASSFAFFSPKIRGWLQASRKRQVILSAMRVHFQNLRIFIKTENSMIAQLQQRKTPCPSLSHRLGRRQNFSGWGHRKYHFLWKPCNWGNFLPVTSNISTMAIRKLKSLSIGCRTQPICPLVPWQLLTAGSDLSFSLHKSSLAEQCQHCLSF